jgi:hypothetical protein
LSLNRLIRSYLQTVAGGDDPGRSIEEFKRLSGKGHSRGWRFTLEQNVNVEAYDTHSMPMTAPS